MPGVRGPRWLPMHAKSSHEGDGQGPPPEVRAGFVLVRPKGSHHAGCSPWVTRRGRTWVLPLMRVVALAASMLCLTPTRGMGTGMSMMDAWGASSESDVYEDRRSHV